MAEREVFDSQLAAHFQEAGAGEEQGAEPVQHGYARWSKRGQTSTITRRCRPSGGTVR
jgi:hypothetical protein